MGRAKSVADVSDRIQELEELVRKYEEHEGCTFPAAFKIQKLMDILPEDAERQLTLESTNTKPIFESLKSRVSPVGAVEPQRQVCNGLLARWQWRRSGRSKRPNE